jgi:hypothetical protein
MIISTVPRSTHIIGGVHYNSNIQGLLFKLFWLRFFEDNRFTKVEVV